MVAGSKMFILICKLLLVVSQDDRDHQTSYLWFRFIDIVLVNDFQKQ